MLVARDWGSGNGELLSSGYRVAVRQDGEVLETCTAVCIEWIVQNCTLKMLRGWTPCYAFFFTTIKNCWQDQYFFKVLLFIGRGVVLWALFEKAEVTLSRVYVSSGFHCIMVEVHSNVKVSGFSWKTQHIKSELLGEFLLWLSGNESD